MKMALQCRSCLTAASSAYVTMTSLMTKTITYFEGFNLCTQLQAEANDDKPETLCADCASELWRAFKFMQMSRRSDIYFQDGWIEKSPTSLCGDAIEIIEALDENGSIVGEIENEVDEYSELEIMAVEAIDESLFSEDYSMEDQIELDETTQHTAEVKSKDDGHNSEQTEEEELDEEYLIEYNSQDSLNEADDSVLEGLEGINKWKCSVCNLVLRGDVSYEGHMNMHKNLRPHKCIHCNAAFRCKSTLDRHSRERHQTKLPSKRFKCGKCEKVFCLKNLLMEHEQLEHLAFQCSLCSTSYNSDVDLELHLYFSQSNATSNLTCPFCVNSFAPAKLVEHMRIQHNSEYCKFMTVEGNAQTKWQCGTCNKFFCSNLILQDHQTTHSTSSLYQCPECPKNYTKADMLDKHICAVHQQTEKETVENENNFLVECVACKKQIMSHNLDRHNLKHAKQNLVTHEEEKKFLCSYCPRQCRNHKSLQRHEKMHDGEADGIVYPCPECNRNYATQLLLDQHTKQAHKERNHICNICGNAFKLRNQLVNHMKLHMEKNIQCSLCEKRYARHFDLNVHMRTHTGEQPYSCHLCNKRFAIKVRLTYHLQRHYGIKHTCRECNAEFNSKQKLKAHSYKHTGMPYRCEMCDGRGFPNRDVFKRHLSRVHNAVMTDEALVEMFQHNTGKSVRIRTIDEIEQITGETGNV